MNPVSSTTGNGDARVSEPSMEEILASIRRIIADDQSFPGHARADAGSSKASSSSVDQAETGSIHVLHTEVSRDPAPVIEPARQEQVVAGQETVDMAPRGSIAAPQYPGPDSPALASHPAFPRDEAQSETSRMEAHAPKLDLQPNRSSGGEASAPRREPDRFSTLHRSDAAALSSAATDSSVATSFNVLAASRLASNSEELLGMARDMLRPLLRTWLDDNLPSMVERLVRDEIERVARGGG